MKVLKRGREKGKQVGDVVTWCEGMEIDRVDGV